MQLLRRQAAAPIVLNGKAWHSLPTYPAIDGARIIKVERTLPGEGVRAEAAALWRGMAGATVRKRFFRALPPKIRPLAVALFDESPLPNGVLR